MYYDKGRHIKQDA